MPDTFRVFLSSTGQDLAAHRQAIFDALQLKREIRVVRMEDFVGDPRPPRQLCAEEVAACQIFVCLVGFAYGSCPGDEEKSYTHLEFDTAIEANLPILGFRAPEGTALPFVNEPDEIRERLFAFRAELGEGRTLGRSDAWETQDKLALHVQESVEGQLDHLREGLLREEFERKIAEIEGRQTGASANDQARLAAEKAELERRLSDVEAALKEREAKVAELTGLLRRGGNEIGGDRLQDAIDKLEAGDFSEADEIFAEIEERERLHVEAAARAAFGRGEIAEEQVRWADAADAYQRAARYHPTYANLDKAHEFLWRSGQFSKAAAVGEDKLEAVLREFGNGSEEHAKALNDLALMLKTLGRLNEAEPLYRQALEIDEATTGTGHPAYASRLNNLAALLRDMGRFEEAEPLYRKALEIDEATIGTRHPDYATRLSNLANLLRDMGRFGEAEPLFAQALDITEATLGTGHPDYATHLNNLAGLLRAMGRYEEAEPLYRQALEIDEATIGTGHPAYASRLNNLASLLQTMDRFEEAEPLLQQAKEITVATLGTGHPEYATHLNNLGVLYANMGRFDDAIPLVKRAIVIKLEKLGPEHPDTKSAERSLASMKAARGD